MARRQAGQVVVQVAIMAGVLFGFLALALDAGNYYVQRRRMQNAADAGALAGASEICLATGVGAEGRALEYAITRNGAQRAFAAVVQSTVIVTTELDVDTFIAGLIGIEQLPVSAVAAAAADCGEYILWAASSSCDQTIAWTANNGRMDGSAHSNYDFYMPGQNNVITGSAEYDPDGGYFEGNNNDVTWTESEYTDRWPSGSNLPDIEDYRPGGAFATYPAYNHLVGNQHFKDGDPQDGIYYVEGDVSITSANIQREVTIVAEGKIESQGNNLDLRPFSGTDHLLFFSNRGCCDETDPNNCNQVAIRIAGTGFSMRGVVFAPYQEVEMAGENTALFEGAILANTIWMNGNNKMVANYGAGAASIYLIR
jgi:hypothetical protein